jgi:hypothetical protein
MSRLGKTEGGAEVELFGNEVAEKNEGYLASPRFHVILLYLSLLSSLLIGHPPGGHPSTLIRLQFIGTGGWKALLSVYIHYVFVKLVNTLWYHITAR